MSKNELYCTMGLNGESDTLWETYLQAYPSGTNPIYRTNSTYDCNCCKHFIKNVGGVVGFGPGPMF